MTCDRCINIHEEQKSGRTLKACECECHNCTSGGVDISGATVFSVPIDTLSSYLIDNTCGDVINPNS